MEQSLDYRSLPLSDNILRAVEAMGFTEMTEIQQKAIQPGLEGRDIIAKAPTGTGKTCAFGIPILERIDLSLRQPQALILSPTRELATQIRDELRELGQFFEGLMIAVVYGGQSMQRQIDALKKGAQIVVATPGRLQDHIDHRTIRLDRITTVVLDEADRMLDMGFYRDVKKILDRIKSRKQLMMFSATISREVMDIGWLYQRDPVELTVLPVEESQPKIEQYWIETTGRRKLEDINDIMRGMGYRKAIVFCNTKYTTGMLERQLQGKGFNVACINGDMRQSDRNKVMADFKTDKLDILVATDVAARGIDISEVEVVFNYDMPQDNDSYLHRIGRTGRAKHEGTSYLFVTEDDFSRLKNILRYTKLTIHPMTFDENRKLVPVTDSSI